MNNTSKVFWWIFLAAASIVAGFLGRLISLPGNWMLGALIVAIAAGLGKPKHPKVAPMALLAAQAVIGTIVSGRFRADALPIIGGHWLAVGAAVGMTLAVSLAAGAVLPRISALGRETAAFGTLPGGASSMIAMSIGSKADARMVALMQYTRLVLAVLLAVFLARFVLPGNSGASPASAIPAQQPMSHPLLVYLITALIALCGSIAGRRMRLPAGAFLGPMVLGIALSGFNIIHPALPPVFASAAYILMGLYVGLLFDRASIRQAGKLLPVMLGNTLVLMGICAATGKMLSLLTHSDYLTGYLATTPGGMDSITVIALGSGANVSFILAVQMVRLLAIVLLGPFLVKRLLGKTVPAPLAFRPKDGEL